MLPVAGYADRLSVRPGETIRFHVSNATGRSLETSLVRVICADANPAGPGITTETLAAQPREVARPGPHGVGRGSYAVVPMAGALAGLRSFSVFVTVSLVGAGRPGCILSIGEAGHPKRSLVFSAVTVEGGVGFRASLPLSDGAPAVLTTAPVDPASWHQLALSCDAVSGIARLSVAPVGGTASPAVVELILQQPIEIAAEGDVRIGGGIGGEPGTDAGSLSGRIERPMLFRVPLQPSDLASLTKEEVVSDLVAAWDFSQSISTDSIVDIGPGGFHGHTVNGPARGMTGHNWTGAEMCWRHAPGQYGAIHFHEDDLDDCRWPVAYEWTVPAGTRSGNYALLLRAAGGAGLEESDNIPFFVVPPKGAPSAKVAVLVSTFTYTVYANHVRPEWASDPQWKADWRTQAKEWGAYPHHPGDHPEYAQSTYNYHADGSGISISSWHRPMLNIRIGYITYPHPAIRGSGARHYQPDTHLTAWLEHKGIAYDVITDWELHSEGYELLKSYPVLLTGTHPEYHTREMLDALTAYRDGGGRLCYLGGNGFYWKIALHPAKAGVIEIRRGEGGIRAWAAEPGEYYNQFDGEYGGLWRRNGRPPQKLVGVGFTAQGNFVGSYYRRTAEARDPRVAWMLEGIDSKIFGDFGLSGHGAAGFELDRVDKRLGSPSHALVVARSENHPPDAPWVLVPEEQLTHLVTWPGRPVPELIRADMTFFETSGGRGAVFSTGSITFCGSLPVNRFDNDVSRLLENVVRRFLDPTPFEAVGAEPR